MGARCALTAAGNASATADDLGQIATGQAWVHRPKMTTPPNYVDAEFKVVPPARGVKNRLSGDGLWLGYLSIGQALGGITAVVTFIAAWIYCISTAGFLVGVLLGWIAAGIVASVAGALVAFLWGPIAIGAIWFAISLSNASNSSRASYPSVPTTVQATAAAPLAAPVAATPTATQAPSAPTVATSDRAIEDFQRAYGTAGMAGAVTYTMECYNKLQAQQSVGQWDLCATFDQLGANQSANTAAAGGAPTEYFAPFAVSERQARNAFGLGLAASDRIAALKAMIAQSFENRRLASLAAAAVASSSTVPLIPQPASPSFDCARVVSENLKLICSTPSLAQADLDLASAYRAAMNVAPSPETLKASERDWLRRRNAAPADVEGLAAMFAERTSQLKAMAARPTPNTE